MRLRTRGKVVVAIMLAILASGGVARAGAEEEIRSVYDRYREAVLAKAGETVASLMSKESIAYHQTIRDLALDGTREVLKQRLLVEQNQVLLLRLRMTREELEKLSGQALVAHFVSKGWVTMPGTTQATLGKVQLKGSEALGQSMIGERAGSPDYFRFAKEEAGWRFDSAYSNKRGEQSLKSMQRNRDPQQFVMAIVMSVSEMPVDESIWEPLRKSNPGRLEGHSTLPDAKTP